MPPRGRQGGPVVAVGIAVATVGRKLPPAVRGRAWNGRRSSAPPAPTSPSASRAPRNTATPERSWTLCCGGPTAASWSNRLGTERNYYPAVVLGNWREDDARRPPLPLPSGAAPRRTLAHRTAPPSPARCGDCGQTFVHWSSRPGRLCRGNGPGWKPQSGRQRPSRGYGRQNCYKTGATRHGKENSVCRPEYDHCPEHCPQDCGREITGQDHNK